MIKSKHVNAYSKMNMLCLLSNVKIKGRSTYLVANMNMETDSWLQYDHTVKQMNIEFYM